MYKYDPTLSGSETGRNARRYIKDNHHAFWSIMKPLIPVIIGLTLLDTIISQALSTDEETVDFSVGYILIGYLYTTLSISWHRLVIHGPDNFIAMSPLKPKKNELKFLFVGLGLGIAGAMIGVILGVSSTFAGPIAALMAIPILIVAYIFIFVRISFYFPALATDNPISLKQAFRMTKGYVSSILLAGFFASWRMILIAYGYVVAIGIVSVGTIMILGEASALLNAVGFILIVPIIAYIQPILMILNVTVLSNYYQRALQYGQTDDGHTT